MEAFVALLLLIVPGCLCNGPVEISTPLGKVQGHLKTSFNGRKFMAFEGIPYAKPPIGKYRFSEPQPIEPWMGTWQATNLYECSQLTVDNQIAGDDDCLYVNVYVPRESPSAEEKLDVVVHFHGGGFIWGSGHEYSKPEYIMDTDMIFITLNYRLGIFGFLSTQDKVISGNNGLKDQVLALKWVKENIASFGGNPDSVTITGMSAGGASVHLHYFSPLSRGLFHRGISQSGTALNFWASQNQPLKKAKNFAGLVGCPTSSTKAIAECLRERPTNLLLQKMRDSKKTLFDFSLSFTPVVESTDTKKPFLFEHPFVLLSQNRVRNVPWISSNTADEGLFPAVLILDNFEQINENWESVAPGLLNFRETIPESLWASTAKKIKEFYGDADKGFTINSFVKVFTDRMFSNEAETAVRLQSQAEKSPVYYYHFNYESGASFTQLFVPDKKFPGVCHMDDGFYFFANMLDGVKPTEEDLKMKDAFMGMLASYAKTGVPQFKGLTWAPTEYKQLTYLNISGPDSMEMKTVDELTQRKFWASLNIKENENQFKSSKDEL